MGVTFEHADLHAPVAEAVAEPVVEAVAEPVVLPVVEEEEEEHDDGDVPVARSAALIEEALNATATD